MNVVRIRTPDEPKIIPNGAPTILSEGRIGAIVQFPVLVDEGKGYIAKVFEKFVRAPGTRIIAVQNKTIYLQQEARLERNNVLDWRLPGGKVVDSFNDYRPYLTQAVPEAMILAAAAKELREEAQLEATQLRFFAKKECGATVEWDLYYILAEEICGSATNKLHEEGEDIHQGKWFTFTEILDKCAHGEISEGRTVAALLEFVATKTSFLNLA